MRTAILLAAGRSRRFADANKLLASYRGQPLIHHALRAAKAASAGRVIVVVGHDRHRMAAYVRQPRVTLVFAKEHRSGLASSLRAGLAALRPMESQIFVFLGDMPAIPAGLSARLARAMRPGDAAVRPRGRAGPGHPVLLRRPPREMMKRLEGDSGLGRLISGRTRWMEQPGYRPADIDTRRDLARWR